jgi:hypothetical protein
MATFYKVLRGRHSAFFGALGVIAMVGGLACTQNTGEELGTDQARISEGECLAENGTWANGECTLNGGGMGDVEIHPDDDEVCMPGDCSCDPHQMGCGDDGTGGGGGGGGDDNGGGGGSGGGGGDDPSSDITQETYTGQASGLNVTNSEASLHALAAQRAMARCNAERETTPNGVNHCEAGNYIWGNRVVTTTHSTSCSVGYIYTTCNSVVTVRIQVIRA